MFRVATAVLFAVLSLSCGGKKTSSCETFCVAATDCYMEPEAELCLWAYDGDEDACMAGCEALDDEKSVACMDCMATNFACYGEGADDAGIANCFETCQGTTYVTEDWDGTLRVGPWEKFYCEMPDYHFFCADPQCRADN